MRSLGKVERIRSRMLHGVKTGIIITEDDYELQFPQTFYSIEEIEWMHGKELTVVGYVDAGHVVCEEVTIAVIQRIHGLVLQVTFYPIAAAHACKKLESE